MIVTDVCLDCGGSLALYPSGHWKHASAPSGTDPHQARRAATDRATIEARGREMLDRAAEWNRTHPRPAVAPIRVRPQAVTVAALHPEPIEPARDATEDEIPKTAMAVIALMADHGWVVVDPQYARGYKLGSLTVVDNLVLGGVRLASKEKVVAWWEDSGYGGGYHLSPQGPQAVNYTELRKIITSPVLLCDTCGLPPLAHPIPRESPDCFQEER